MMEVKKMTNDKYVMVRVMTRGLRKKGAFELLNPFFIIHHHLIRCEASEMATLELHLDKSTFRVGFNTPTTFSYGTKYFCV